MAEGVEEAEAPLADGRGQAVLIMTVHKAKGLEFPYVFLVNGDAVRGQNSAPAYLAQGFGLVPRRPDRRPEAEEPALYTLLKARDLRLEQEEFRRLFYVAATRARERLFLSGADDSEHGSWLHGFLSALGVTLQEGQVSVMVAPVPGANVAISVTGVEPLTGHAKGSNRSLAGIFRDGLLTVAHWPEFWPTAAEAAALPCSRRKSPRFPRTCPPSA